MRWILKCIGAVILFTFLAFALAWVTMLLWNWLVPSLFNGPEIRYIEAAGLMILGRLLVGGFGGGGSKHWHNGNCEGGHHSSWKKRWEERMMGMSDEDKEKFLSGMKKCNWSAKDSSSAENDTK